MRTTRKALSLFLALIMVIGLFPVSAFADEGTIAPADDPVSTGTIAITEEETTAEDLKEPAEGPEQDYTEAKPSDTESIEQAVKSNDLRLIIDSGTCGANLAWELSDSGVLTITGDGDMYDYNNLNQRTRTPWYSSRVQISEVVLPEGLTKIGDWAFEGCTVMSSINLPSGLVSIGSSAFRGCTALKSITFAGSAPSIASDAFAGCTLTACYPGEDASWIEDVLQNYGGVITWEPVFQYLASGTCGDSLNWRLTEDGELIITGTGAMTNYTVTPWDSYCAQIKTVVLPEGITTIGGAAFSKCSELTRIDLPEGITKIGKSAFASCTKLTDITIPAGVTSIGNLAFSACSSLTKITFLGSAPAFGNTAFNSVTATAYYPGDDASWTEDVLQNYGGTITWVALIKSYDLYITGQQIKDTNLSGQINGTLNYAYDAEANILHMSGIYDVPSDYAYDYVIWNAIQGLTIQVDSVMTLSTAFNSGQDITFIRTTKDMTITDSGDYDLDISGSGGSGCIGIAVGSNAKLTIADTRVSIYRNVAYGIDGGTSGSSKLNFINARADIIADAAAIYRFGGGVTLTRCSYIRPFRASPDGNGTICDATGTTPAADVRIGVVSTYALAIDGTAVTEENKDNILGTWDPIFSFDPDTNTLTVNGVWDSTSNAPMIENHIINGLTIKTNGATLTCRSTSAATTGVIVSYGNLTIEAAEAGDKLVLNGNGAYNRAGIQMVGGYKLTIDNAALNVAYAGYGLRGDMDGYNSSLEINAADLDLDTYTAGIYSFMGSTSTSDCEFVLPAYPEWKDGSVKIYTWDSSNDHYQFVPHVQVSSKTYKLIIDGVRAWEGNLDSLPGGFIFDPDTNTLTAPYEYTQKTANLNSYHDRPVIDNSIDGLTLKIVTGTTLVSRLENYNTYVPVINSVGSMTIMADDSLDTPQLGLYSFSNAISFDGIHIAGDLTLRNIDLRIDHCGHGLKGNGLALSTLTFDAAKANITCNSSADDAAAVKYFTGGVYLENGSAFVKSDFTSQNGMVYDQEDIATALTVVTGSYKLYINGYVMYDERLEMYKGQVRYDPTHNVLYLNGNGGDLAASTVPFIENHITDLTIYVENAIRITTTAAAEGRGLIESDRDLTIQSAPLGGWAHRLVLDGNTANVHGILMKDNAKLTLDDTDVLVKNTVNGLFGEAGTASLLIDNSDLKVNAAAEAAAVTGFGGGIDLETCDLIVPEIFEISDGVIYEMVGGNLKTAAEEVQITRGITLPAYTVTFDVQGHGTAPLAQSVRSGQVAEQPEDPAETGWVFLGWYTDEACTAAYEFTTPVTADITLYAEWGYALWLGETIVTEANKDDILGDGTASYDPATQTLTFTTNEPNIEGTHEVDRLPGLDPYTAKIYSKSIPLTINAANGLKLSKYTDYSIYVNDELTINGNISSSCINALRDLTFNGNVTIETFVPNKSHALLDSGGSLVINGDLYGYCRNQDILYNVYAFKDITVSGDVKINGSHKYGVYSWSGSVNVGSGTWEVTGSEMAFCTKTGINIPETSVITKPEGGRVGEISNTLYSPPYTIFPADSTTAQTYVKIEPVTPGVPSNITSSSVDFNGKLYLNTYIKLSDEILADPDAYVRVTFNGETKDRLVTDLIQTYYDTQGRVKVRLEMFAAMLRDEMTLQVFNGAGEVQPLTYKETTDVTDGFVYTALEYLKGRQEQSTNPYMVELAKAAELYGTAVQVYFDYHTEPLTVNEIAAMKAAANAITIPASCAETLTGTLPAGVTKRTKTVMFESDNALRQYFYIDGGNIKNYTFTLNGKTVKAKKLEAGKYYVQQPNIASGLLSTKYSFSVSDGTDTYTIESSALGYAYDRQENSSDSAMINLSKLLYRYSQAADAYFGQ